MQVLTLSPTHLLHSTNPLFTRKQHPFDDPEYLQSIPDSDAAAARRLADDDGHSEVAHSARLNQQKKDEDENRSLGTKIKVRFGWGPLQANPMTDLPRVIWWQDKITGTTKKERDEKKRKEIAQERVSPSPASGPPGK
jgi:hypothetical protein